MNTKINKLINQAEGRYLTSDEINQVLDFTRGFESRFQIMQAIEQVEAQVVKTTIEKTFDRFPNFPKERPQAYDKASRDISLVLRYATLAVVNQDTEIFTERLLYWMGTVVHSQGFADVAEYCYVTLQQELNKALPQTDLTQVNACLQMMVDLMKTGSGNTAQAAFGR